MTVINFTSMIIRPDPSWSIQMPSGDHSLIFQKFRIDWRDKISVYHNYGELVTNYKGTYIYIYIYFFQRATVARVAKTTCTYRARKSDVIHASLPRKGYNFLDIIHERYGKLVHVI